MFRTASNNDEEFAKKPKETSLPGLGMYDSRFVFRKLLNLCTFLQIFSSEDSCDDESSIQRDSSTLKIKKANEKSTSNGDSNEIKLDI